jgi:hypothetical protein
VIPRWVAIPFLLGMGARLLMAAYRGYIKREFVTANTFSGASYRRSNGSEATPQQSYRRMLAHPQAHGDSDSGYPA